MENKKIITPTISEIIKEEYLIPFHVSYTKLAKDIYVSIYKIKKLINSKGRIDAELSIKLGKYFGVSEKYFINLQSDIDIRKAKSYEKL